MLFGVFSAFLELDLIVCRLGFSAGGSFFDLDRDFDCFYSGYSFLGWDLELDLGLVLVFFAGGGGIFFTLDLDLDLGGS